MGLLLGLRGGTLAPSRLVDLAPAAVDVVAFDAFTDANGTLLENHVASDGGAWTKHPISGAGSAAIAANRVHNTNTSSVHIYTHGWLPANADYDVETDVVLVTDNDLGVGGPAGRIDPTENTYYAIRYSTVDNTWLLFKAVAGIITSLASSVPQVLTPGQVYRSRLALQGTRISMLVDGLPLVSVVDTAIAAGRPGLRVQGAATATTGVHLDAWRVRQGG